MPWPIGMTSQVRRWLVELEHSAPSLYLRALTTIELLRQHGPHLGRPLADRIHGSSIHNLKELRISHQRDHSLRLLYAFDSQRRAVLLFAGNKAGDWNHWYPSAIHQAEDFFAHHERNIDSHE